MSRRTERVANVIRGVVAEAISARISDPRLEPLTSITRVELSEDMSVAHVNVSVLSENPARRALSVRALQSAAGRIRKMVADHLATRTIPRIEFHLDDSLQRGFRVVQTLDRLADESAAARAASNDPDPSTSEGTEQES